MFFYSKEDRGGEKNIPSIMSLISLVKVTSQWKNNNKNLIPLYHKILLSIAGTMYLYL